MISDERKGNQDVEAEAEHQQIIGVLKQMEAGRTAAEMARETGVSKHTIYAWKSQFGGMEVNEAEELRSLREENQRLKKLVADLSLDKDMLKSMIQKKRVQLAGLRARREVARDDARHVLANFSTSVRRACELSLIPRSTFRFERDQTRDEPLRTRLIELAQEKPRYDYRRLAVLLRWEGAVVNHKKLFRIYRAAGLPDAGPVSRDVRSFASHCGDAADPRARQGQALPGACGGLDCRSAPLPELSQRGEGESQWAP